MPSEPFESREAHSIRFKPTEWKTFETLARARGVEPSVLVRECARIGLRSIESGSVPLVTDDTPTPLAQRVEELLALVARGKEAEDVLRGVHKSIASSGLLK